MPGIKIYILSLMLMFGASNQLFGNEPSASVKHAVTKYFELVFQVPSSEFEINWLHVPVLTKDNLNGTSIVADSRRETPCAGHQTLWIKVMRGSTVLEEQPITLNMTVNLDVVVAGKDFDRGMRIDTDGLEIRKYKFDDDLAKVFRKVDDVAGMIANRLIRKDEPIDSRMVKIAPDIVRGQIVKVEFKTSSMVVSTEGTAKADAAIGDPVKVECKPTGKLVQGTVHSADIVIVEVK